MSDDAKENAKENAKEKSKRKLKAPPKNIDAEKYFLGACFQDRSVFDRNQASSQPLKSEMFFNGANRLIFESFISMATKGDFKTFDPLAVKVIIERTGLIERCPMAYISQVFSTLPQMESGEYYASVVKDYYDRRCVLALNEEISDRIYDAPLDDEDNSMPVLLGEFESRIQKLQDELAKTDDNRPQSVYEIFQDWKQRAEEQERLGISARGVKTGFTDLDNVIGGLRPGTMNIIAAQPGVGKTALGLNIIENIVCSEDVKDPAIVFSLEMTKDMIMWRVLSALTNVPVKAFQNSELSDADKGRIENAMNKYEYAVRYKLIVDDHGKMTPALMRQACRRLRDRVGGISCILVDHVQIMQGDEKSYSNDVRQYADISRKLKILSKDFKCPVIVLSQLSRKIDDRKDHEPKNSDLKETSGLEQDADLIAFIQRDMENPENGQARLKITKNRHGGLATIDLSYNNELTLFGNAQSAYY